MRIKLGISLNIDAQSLNMSDYIYYIYEINEGQVPRRTAQERNAS